MTFAWSQWISTVSSRYKKLGLESRIKSTSDTLLAGRPACRESRDSESWNRTYFPFRQMT